jgi:hypothetical protein
MEIPVKYLLALAVVLLGRAISVGQNAQVASPEANPARPTVATPATLIPLGYLQFETGGFWAQTSPEFSTLENMNEVVKLTVHPRLELIAEVNPIASASGNVQKTQFGGMSVGFQSVLFGLNESHPTLSVSYLHEVVGSDVPDTDIGTPTNSGLVLFSADAVGFHFDINGLFSEQTVNNVSRTQFGQAISISHPVWKLTAAGEIWHFTQPFLKSNCVGTLWALSYAVRKNVVLDAGFSHGLTNTSTQWEEFFGFTYLLPHRLWKR